MSVRLKLMTIVLFVALLPVSISAYSMLRVHSDSSNLRLAELHQKNAELGATFSRSYLENASNALGSLVRDRIDWAALSAEERTQVLWLIYEQLDGVVVVSLLDEAGKGIGPSVYRDAAESAAVLHGRPIISTAQLTRYAHALPHERALQDGYAIGEALPPTADADATLPLAFAVRGTEGQRWVVGVALSLSPVCAQLTENRSRDTRLSLLSKSGASLCQSPEQTGPPHPRLVAALPATQPATLSYPDSQENRLLAATAPAGADWSIVATQYASTAFAPRRRIQKQIVFWIGFGVLGALVAGVFLARGITRPIATLSQATGQIAAGHYDCQLVVDGRDEFAQLSNAFNIMSAEVRSWNTELTNRVDERTRALSEAQEQLLESKKMAAVSSMSAGIAHEINNPLTAVISFAQVLEARAGRDPAQANQASILSKLTESALRIHDIVKRMQRLSEESARGMAKTPPHILLEGAIHSMQEKLEARNVELCQTLEPRLPDVFVQASQLQHALVQILDNAINSLDGETRRIAIAARRMGDDLLQIEITDTGRGIPESLIKKIFEPFYTLKSEWRGQGLGLAEAKQIVTANHGTITVRSEVGAGTTMNILLPVATEQAHLV